MFFSQNVDKQFRNALSKTGRRWADEKSVRFRRLRNQSAFNVNVFVCSVTYLGDVIEGNTVRAPRRERFNDEAPSGFRRFVCMITVEQICTN